jgi:RNA polymerase-binding transcription factor DksA
MAEQTDDEIRAELSDIEQTLSRLRGEGAGEDDAPGDQADRAQDLTAYEEEQALIDNLEQRRQALTSRLSQ